MKIKLHAIKNRIFHLIPLRRIDSTVHFTGKKYISIGRNTLISQNTWLNVNQRYKEKHIVIGDYCFIGRNNFFTSGELIQFDDYVITSVNCCFIGASHDYSNPLIPYYFAQTTNAKTIEVGFNVFIGANTTVIGNVMIEYGSVIGANTLIKDGEYPPFSLLVGNPGKVVKRYSFKDKVWKKIDNWNHDDEMSIVKIKEYKKSILEQKFERGLPLKAIGKSNGNLFK
ncbi:acyltransferase [Treponema primitia]|uniref:acyltransferase n=1 Tax=Treponema primitia TaxID=88058 RepID=UPI0002555601|nr:acyltransferase [Treponema primitia]